MTSVNKNLRPPVVVVVGHVDHGKTAILDYIRQAKVAEGESGGITQHIGAYQIEHAAEDSSMEGGGTITFIDTPGHEAFSAMRSRGVNVADIAVLVVAADDGIMPQTKEALEYIQSTGLSFVVAINKIDKPGADANKVKNQLVKEGILLEGYGGSVPNVSVSAQTGEGIDELLNMINLVAELEELTFEKDTPLEAVVIESSLNPQKGPTATLLVQEGTMRVGEFIAGSTTWGKVKNMENFKGESVKEGEPSMPVSVLGLSNVPQVGEKFVQVNSQKEAEERVEQKSNKQKEANVVNIEEGQSNINVILKSDAEGTLEAVHDVIRSIENENLNIRVLKEETGNITDSDIKLAQSGDALVIGFRVKLTGPAKKMLQQHNVKVATYDTVYEMVEGVRSDIGNMLEPNIRAEEIGEAQILEIFRTTPSRIIAGGKVVNGKIKRGAEVQVLRNDEEKGKGVVKSLKIVDKDVGEVEKGKEFGMMFEGSVKLEKGDRIIAREQVEEEVQF